MILCLFPTPTVLEARVKQLQADNVSEFLINKVQLTVSRTSELPQPPLQKVPAARQEHFPKHGERTAVPSSRWLEKLTKEKSIKYKRFLRLEAKLTATISGPQTKPVSSRRGKTQVDKSTSKQPAPKKAKEPGKTSKAAAVKSPSTAEAPVPFGSNDGAPEELGEQLLTLEGAMETLPLEEDDGTRHGSIQLSILSYLDCCVSLQQPERAQQCLLFYHRSHTRKKLLDVRMYNLVMHGYAKKVE